HRVRSHAFENIYAVILQLVGQRRANSGVVLVVACAFELHGLAVEEETSVGIPPERPDAKAHALGIADLATGFDGYESRIKVRSLWRPPCRIRQRRTGCECRRAICRDLLGRGIGAGDRFASCVENLPTRATGCRLRALVLDNCAEAQG